MANDKLRTTCCELEFPAIGSVSLCCNAFVRRDTEHPAGNPNL